MEKKILVVDNHPMVLKLMANLLAKEGHEVRTAADGLTALEELKSFVPHIIFVDLVMPNISGEKLCRIIRNMPHLKDVFLVILSAIAAEEKLDFLALGADACIAKGSVVNLSKHLKTILKLEKKPRAEVQQREIIGLDDVHQREITRELLSSRKHFEIILNHMAEGILEYNQEFKVIYANPIAATLIGIEEEKMLGHDFVEIFDKASRPKIEKLLTKKKLCKLKTLGDDGSVTLDGRKVLLQFLSVDDAEDTGTIVIIRDVTKRLRAEEKIKDQNRFLSRLLESLPHPFYVVDAESYQVLHANSAAVAKIAQLEAGDGESSIGLRKAGTAPEPHEPLECVKESGKPCVMEYAVLDTDGERAIYEIHAYPIYNKAGELIQIILYSLDISQRKKAEQALRDSKEELQQALDDLRVAQEVAIRQEKLASIGTLASGVAHEILNPLNIIATLAQMMQLEEVGDEVRKNLEEMLLQIKRASKITNNLRSFAHQHDFDLSTVNLNLLFDKTAILLEHDLNLDNIHIERQFDLDLPSIEADEDQLAQVFLNLIKNARDAMHGLEESDRHISDRHIVVRTTAVEGGVQLEVSDTGPGVESRHLGKIFDPFFTTKGPGYGTGLGLWIVYSIIESHGGTIGVDSNYNDGTRFTIFLPAKHMAVERGEEE